MPKQEVGSTKWLGNKMKAKGLQKLRWYCQMCQKQCRDENGFKCHRMSDGHQRQMQLFVQNPNSFMDDFSQEFQEGFMQLMSHSYRSTRVLANTVYCDFISNRHHTHMNSTIWVTLSNFVQYLGRTNQCKIDKTPKGWYLQYVDNSPEARLRAQQKQDMETAELSEQDQHARLLAQQVEEGMAGGGFQESEFTELQREEGDAPISFAMSSGAGATSSSSSAAAAAATAAATAAASAARAEAAQASARRTAGPGGNVLQQAFAVHSSSATSSGSHAKEQRARKVSAMESVRLEHEASKKQRSDAVTTTLPSSTPEAWLASGLVVKVMHQDLGDGKYYRKKGRIEKVHDRYAADVRMQDSRDLIRLEQELLETVIPNVGKPVCVVKGTHRGRRAMMQAVDFQGFCVTIELDDGTVMEGLGYEDVCKYED